MILPMLCYVIHAFSHLLLPKSLDSSLPLIAIAFQKTKEQLSPLKKKKKKSEGGGLRVVYAGNSA